MARERAWRRGLRAGIAASVEHDELPLRRDYRTVIDVGANQGQFALYASVRFSDADVYSLEPLPDPRSRLSRLFAGNARVHVIAAAAGSAPGTARINVSRADDSSSLLPATDRQLDRFPGTDTVGQVSVQVETLDRILERVELVRPVLLKLDVQGFELEALRGAERVLASVDTVLTECSFVPFYAGQALFDEVRDFLDGHGFRLVGGSISAVDDCRWEQGDFVFER